LIWLAASEDGGFRKTVGSMALPWSGLQLDEIAAPILLA
jgi:hypothetical protein